MVLHAGGKQGGAKQGGAEMTFHSFIRSFIPGALLEQLPGARPCSGSWRDQPRDVQHPMQKEQRGALSRTYLKFQGRDKRTLNRDRATKDSSGRSPARPALWLGAPAGRATPRSLSPGPDLNPVSDWNPEINKTSETRRSLARWWQMHSEAKPDLSSVGSC